MPFRPTSQLAARIALIAVFAVGCGAPVCTSLRPTIEERDVPIGMPATQMRVLAAQPDQRWVVYSRTMRDTNGDGVIWPREDYYWRPPDGDDPDVFLALGGAPPQPIDAFLGATENEIGVVRDGMLELLHVRTGARRQLGMAPPLTLPTMTRDPQLPRDARMLPNGLVVWPTRDRRGAELLNTEDGTRRVIPSPGWVHSVWVDATRSWAVVESIDSAPADPSDWQQRPQIAEDRNVSHPGYGPCWGLSWCGGPGRTFQFVDLNDASASTWTRTFDVHDRSVLRPWGLIVESAEGATLETRDGSLSFLRPRCIVVYAGMESAFVVAHCVEARSDDSVTYGPLFIVRLGSSEEEPFNEQAIASLAEVDRALLRRSDVQAAMHEDHLRQEGWRVDFHETALRWDGAMHAWVNAQMRHHSGAIAVSSDGSALLVRWPSDVGVCGSNPHPVQLVWVQLNERWRRELSVFDYRHSQSGW